MVSDSELESEGIKAASKAFNRRKEGVIPVEFSLSNGILLRIKPIPPMLLNSVANSIPMPEVPKVWLEEKGREEENPNHPKYLQELADRTTKINLATMNLIIYACTEVLDVPEGMWPVDSDKWIPLAKMAGIDFDPEDEVQRYITWVRSYAIQTLDDLNDIQSIPMQLAGITEMEVDDALDTFRSGEERRADSELSSEQPSLNGNNVENIGTRPRGRPRRA